MNATLAKNALPPHEYCILGANGFIGRNLMNFFGSERAYSVVRAELDLEDAHAVDVFFSSNVFNVVVHCVTLGGSRLQPDAAEVYDRNVQTFRNVAKHSHKFNRLVWLSSGAALYAPETPYGASKLYCESLARDIPNI